MCVEGDVMEGGGHSLMGLRGSTCEYFFSVRVSVLFSSPYFTIEGKVPCRFAAGARCRCHGPFDLVYAWVCALVCVCSCLVSVMA